MSLRILILAVMSLPLMASSSLAADEEKTILLHSLDSTDGIKATWGTPSDKDAIQANNDRQFISEGKGSLRLAAHSGKQPNRRYYYGMQIPLKNVDLEFRDLMIDFWTSTPETAQIMYVRLYGAKGKKLASWVSQKPDLRKGERRSVRLQMGLNRDDFLWESKEIAATEPVLIESAEIIIGTRTADHNVDIYADNLRMTEARHVPFARVTLPKKLYRETPLVEGGRPVAVIVTPDMPEYQELAGQIRKRIQDLSGADLPVMKAGDVLPTQMAAQTTILLGNVCNNRGLVPLYALHYTFADDAYPAGDGYLAHTVHDPWGTGKNAVVLSGASLAGTKKAVEAFAKVLQPGRDIVLPKLNLYELDAAEMKAVASMAKRPADREIRAALDQAQQLFAKGGHRTVAGRLAGYGLQYARTGNDLYARLYRDVVFAWYEHYRAKPGTYGGPWGMDMDFHLMEILPAWDLLEESHALSDDDRMQVTKILFEFITTDVVRKASGALKSTRVRFNHTTFPALGLFFAGRYFQHGYHCPEADHWLAIARACFTLQAQAAKPWEDCNGYGWYVPYHTMRYSLANGDPTYFDNGNVRRQADYAILTMDNLGYQVPYGDTGSYQCWWTELPFLRGAEFYHRDGRWAWALEKKQAVHSDTPRNQFVCKVPPKEPADLLGARAIPLDKMYWESSDGPKTLPLDKTVDKVVMRSSFDPSRQYLLLDGLSNGGHMHYDGNSISRITDRGRIWLADNDYIRSLPKFHNSVLVFKEGQAATIPPFCELETVADGAHFGISQTAVRAYTGTDWHRSILWSKERFFLALDELVALEPAEFDFHCLWHVIGDARLVGQGIEVEQQGPRMSIKSLPGVRLRLTDDAELGKKNWDGYPYAEPVVRRLREVQSQKLAQGGRAVFANLLFTADPQSSSSTDYDIVAVGPDAQARAVVIRSPQSDCLAGVGDADQPREVVPGLTLAAQAFLLGETGGLVAGATRVSCGDLTLRSSRPVNFDFNDGQLELTATEPTMIDLPARLGQPVVGGKATIAGNKKGTTVIALEPGKSTIRTSQPIVLAGLGRTLSAVKKAPAPTEAKAAGQVKPGKLLWSFTPENAKKKLNFLALAAGDIDGDGADEAVAASDQSQAYCLDSAGKLRWQFAAKGPVTTATLANLDGNKTKTVVVGSEDCKVYALDPTGKPRWTFDMPTYKAPGRVRVLFAADINADGYDEVIAGGDNWRYYALDHQGRELWHYESVHSSTAGAAADLDGDGRMETLCGTEYYWWPCADVQGVKRWSYSVKMPHATVALSARREGTKERAAIFGSEAGEIYTLDARGILLWNTNVGDQVTAALAVDLNADGHDAIVASSMSFNVVALDMAGKCLWRKNLGDAVLSLTTADLNADGRPEIVAGCEDGRIVVLDAHGQIIAHYLAPGPVTGLSAARLQGPAIVAKTLAGPVVAVRFFGE
jgi:outer membrane protein assembly factor BamB